MIHFLKYALVGLVLPLLLVSCVNPPNTPSPDDPAVAASLVWPKPPQAARIRYLQSIAGPRDWGVDRSWLRRLADALTGGSAEQFSRPSAVAELDDVLYVADPGTQSIWILDRPLRRALRLSTIGADALVSPVALALRSDGAVFVADTALKKVFLLDRAGTLMQTFTSQGLERPAGLAWDEASQLLYVLDSKRHRVGVFDNTGVLLRYFGVSGRDNGQFNYPTHLTINHKGELLVTDALNFRLQTIGQDGRFISKFGKSGNGAGDFAAPKGVAADAQGHYYVVDALFDAVQIFDPQGQLLLTFGERGEKPGQFVLPRGIFISAHDRVYVADAYNHRVQVFLGAIATEKELKK